MRFLQSVDFRLSTKDVGDVLKFVSENNHNTLKIDSIREQIANFIYILSVIPLIISIAFFFSTKDFDWKTFIAFALAGGVFNPLILFFSGVCSLPFFNKVKIFHTINDGLKYVDIAHKCDLEDSVFYYFLNKCLASENKSYISFAKKELEKINAINRKDSIAPAVKYQIISLIDSNKSFSNIFDKNSKNKKEIIKDFVYQVDTLFNLLKINSNFDVCEENPDIKTFGVPYLAFAVITAHSLATITANKQEIKSITGRDVLSIFSDYDNLIGSIIDKMNSKSNDSGVCQLAYLAFKGPSIYYGPSFETSRKMTQRFTNNSPPGPGEINLESSISLSYNNGSKHESILIAINGLLSIISVSKNKNVYKNALDYIYNSIPSTMVSSLVNVIDDNIKNAENALLKF